VVRALGQGRRRATPGLSARAVAARPAPREFNKKAGTGPHVLPVRLSRLPLAEPTLRPKAAGPAGPALLSR